MLPNGPAVKGESVGGVCTPGTSLTSLALKLSRWASRHGTAFAKECAARLLVLRAPGLTGSDIFLYSQCISLYWIV
jgi:hypothetical protein